MLWFMVECDGDTVQLLLFFMCDEQVDRQFDRVKQFDEQFCY